MHIVETVKTSVIICDLLICVLGSESLQLHWRSRLVQEVEGNI